MPRSDREQEDEKLSVRIAVDIGGTFTDLVLEEDGGVVATAKVLTTPRDPAEAVAGAVATLLQGRSPQHVVEIVHGTTLVSNALIERKGVRTGLITTSGFRDVLEMGREQRFDLYDLFLEMPPPLVPRRWRWGVTERVGADGSEVTPLQEDELRDVCVEIEEAELDSIAICFLHSYRTPSHEHRAREIVHERLPHVSVCVSSEVAPEIGEYQRVSTTVANAYVLPVVDRYLAVLEKHLLELGVAAPVRIMLSNGGLASTDTARRFPVRLLESGPAAGVLSAGYVADRGTRVMAFDMGGTTAKAALVEDGQPILSNQHEAARVYRFTRGSGLPITVPVIDMIEIGAGGGSIARKGIFGLPKVGPDSASAEPGPVSYGRGGTAPTVTDADLLLGYLSPGGFLGGRMELDIGAARAALSDLGLELDLSGEETAAAIHRVVNENMASAARMHAVERGRDIRGYALVATGGAGPVHAWGVARALGLRKIIYPPRAGVASAFGMLTAATAFEFSHSLPAPLEGVPWDRVEELLEAMRREGLRQLAESGAGCDAVTIAADLRYQGQGAEVTVDLGPQLPQPPTAAIADRFRAAYERLYGSAPSDVGVEVITWRMRVASALPSPDIGAPLGEAVDPVASRRSMWFAEANGFVEGAVYSRFALPAGWTFDGPAVVEEPESTIVIGPGGRAVITASGNVEVSIDV